MFCRPLGDLVKGRDNLPSAEAPGYFQGIMPHYYIRDEWRRSAEPLLRRVGIAALQPSGRERLIRGRIISAGGCANHFTRRPRLV
jgi:hypothetical protein